MTAASDARPATGASRLSRARLVLILAALTMVGPFTIDAIFPAFEVMTHELGADKVAMQQTMSVYLVAFAAASLFHGSLSDALGRRPVIIAGSLLYAVTSALCTLAPSMWHRSRSLARTTLGDDRVRIEGLAAEPTEQL